MKSIRYLKARCGSLIRDTGADDLARHEQSCPACLGGWTKTDYEWSKAEDQWLDDPRHDQCRNGKFVE